jgi:hypothetical protein
LGIPCVKFLIDHSGTEGLLPPPDVGLYLAELGKQYLVFFSFSWTIYFSSSLSTIIGYLVNLLHTSKFIGVTFSSEFTTNVIYGKEKLRVGL